MGIFKEQKQLEHLITMAGLHIRPVEKMGAASLLRIMQKDKKVRRGKLRFVLPTRIGRVEVFDDVPEKIIKKTLKEYE
ncbi:MAG: hypothetical protein GF384_02425 [Elusimicrobia bacterium]|nr:hypothetical protein [Elusimicrobiota bacterium]MBD3411823.1 hypothetical protein [Elusimicrobiota bacterium]